MSDQPTCPRPDCGRPIHDNAYVCGKCGGDLARALERVALVAGEAATTIARLDRIERTGPNRDPEPEPLNVDTRPGLAWLRTSEATSALAATALPYVPGAADIYDAAVNEITTWARLVSEERGIDLPVVRTATCRHASCDRLRRGVVDGPLCKDGAPLQAPLAVAAEWLLGHDNLRWLRHHPDAETAFRDLIRTGRTIERIVDRNPPRYIVGRCDCGKWLYALRAAGTVRCRGCGTDYDVDASRDALREDLLDRLMTAAQIAIMAVHLGLAPTRDRTRKTVTEWARRHRLVPHGTLDGDPSYRFGDALPLLIEAYAHAA